MEGFATVAEIFIMSRFHMRILAIRFSAISIVLLLAVGCSSTPKASKSAQGLSGTDEQIFVGDTVEKNYDPNVIMKRAESFFEKEEYPEAVIEYQHFLELHRVHTLASYAQYKLAESYFKQIKTVDRDPDPVYKALEAFEKLRKEYPTNRWESEAIERIQNCHNLIAQAYFMVGEFYFRREAYLAAAHRFEAVIQQFPEMDIAGDAVYFLALTYNELGADDWAREQLLALAQQYPSNQHVQSGQKLLAQLNSKIPATQNVAAATSERPSPISANADVKGTIPQVPVSTVTSVSSLRNPSVESNGSKPGVLCRLGIGC